jgi:hypothetical protein
MVTLIDLPQKPKNLKVKSAYLVLKYSHDTARSFLKSFESIRKNRSAKGAATDEEQDLLRAMLIFASAGLDSMLKQLIKDVLPFVIEDNIGARLQFKNYVEKKLIQKSTISSPNIDIKLLSDILVETSPKKALKQKLLDDLTSDSIQSKDQLLKVAAFFGITPDALSIDAKKLKEVFDVRNHIAHEMDIDFKQPNRNRVPRSRDDMVEKTNILLQVADNFLKSVDNLTD